jgi:chromosome partitioning protein
MGAVALSDDDDLAARGRSIFERLRATEDAEPVPEPMPTPDLVPEPPPADVVADILPEDEQPTAQPLVEGAEVPDPAPKGEPETALMEESSPGPAADAAPPEEPAETTARVHGQERAPGEAAAVDEVTTEEPAPDSVVTVVTEAAAALPEPTVEALPSSVGNPFVRPLPRVLAIANQKGGVGKTTTAVNLGASLAELGYRVLVVDLDPQGNATTGLGVNPRTLETSVYDVIMHDTALEDCIEPTSLRNLFVVPATIDLAGAEIELVPAFSRELKLRRALEQVAEDFDFTLIDCPPSLGLITVNGLAAATEVVVPIQCEYYALEGLGQLLRNVSLVQGNLNPPLEVSAIILTMFDARTKLAEQVAREVREHFGDKVCRNIVPRTVRLSEAPSFGQPIIVFDPSSRGAIAYRELAKEVSGGAPQRVG